MYNFKNIIDKSISLAGSKKGLRFLYGLSFAESVFFPIPIDPLLCASVISKPSKTFWISSLTLFFSVTGGFVGWFIGYVLGSGLEVFIQSYPFLDIKKINDFNNMFQTWGIVIVFIGAFTPIPYKVIAISAGATGIMLPVFIIGSILGRGLRFYLIAYLAFFFGESAINFINKNLALSSVIITIIIIALCFLIF